MGLITQQTIKIFEQFAPTEPVEIIEWTTNVTFETIGRVGFGYEFELLKGRDQPPNSFIQAMSYCLKQSIQRTTQMNFVKALPIEANRKFDRSIKLMHDVVDSVIIERKNSPDAKNMEKDLLGYMLNARDEHNLGLSDENIRDQVVTFLIAGHDTTANTLAWTLYELARNPDVQAKVLQEIADNRITWDVLPSSEQISNLKYIHQVIKEILRMYPPVRAIGKYCKKDCIVPGGYKINAGTTCAVQIYAIHHNEEIYPDHNRFDPDRWTPEEEQKRSRFSWLPFSTGPRACIGMTLALQEAKTVLSMLLHRFEFKYEGPAVSYDPNGATTKPMDLYMTIHPRTNFPEFSEDIVHDRSSEIREVASMPILSNEFSTVGTVELPKVTFLFGTQTGTAQDYASQLVNQAKSFGFKNVTLTSMDNWDVIQNGRYQKQEVGRRELVVVCTATYNGQPPDSAENFNKFLDASIESKKDDFFAGLDYAVFGLGNKNWRTYQAFPLKVDACLNELGAERFFAPGVGDADKDMDGDFNEWCAHFWTYILSKYGVTASTSKSVVPTATLSADESDLSTAKVNFIPPTDFAKWKLAKENKNGEYNAQLIVNRELQNEGSDRSTCHIEIDISQLESVSHNKEHLYEAGDHIEIMPENSLQEVERIALGFGLVLDAVFEIDASSVDGLSPRSMAASIHGPCTVRNALLYYADLLSPPSRRMLSYFAAQLHATAPETAEKFDSLTMPDKNNQDQYPEFIKMHRTLLDLQLAFPQVNRIDLGQFLAAVGVMQPRRYSIASSPLVHPKHAHISVGIVDDVLGGKHYPGLSSSYLSTRQDENLTAIRAGLKSSKSTFSMPEDITKPLIMIAAGTGIAPFRGFLQEHEAQIDNGKKIGETVLFFGCRRSDQDYIYQEELESYASSGVLSHLHVAFSRSGEQSPIRYVQHALISNASEVWNLIYPTDPNVKPAAVYVCGSGAMSRDVRRTFLSMALSFGMATTDEEAEKFIDKLMDEKRYLCDVWG
jgi:cytochrome P450/NADPH-cytochrome P450 reductase